MAFKNTDREYFMKLTFAEANLSSLNTMYNLSGICRLKLKNRLKGATHIPTAKGRKQRL